MKLEMKKNTNLFKVSKLEPNTTYYFNIVVENEEGMKTFTTKFQ